MRQPIAIVLFLVLLAGALFFVLNSSAGSEGQVSPSEPVATSDESRESDANAALDRVDQEGISPAVEARVAIEADAKGRVTNLRPGSKMLTGRVVDEAGAPIEGAVVLMVDGQILLPGVMDFDFDLSESETAGPDDALVRMEQVFKDMVTATTSQDGRFELATPAGTRTLGLRVLARGCIPLNRTLARPVEGPMDLGDQVLKAGAVLRGRVVDQNGTGVAGARIEVPLPIETGAMQGADFEMPPMPWLEAPGVAQVVVSDGNGNFELPYLEPGERSVRARHEDHPTTTIGPLTVARGARIENIVLVLERGVSIEGRIVGIPGEVKQVRVVALSRPTTQGAPSEGAMSMFGLDLGELLSDFGVGIGERSVPVDEEGGFVLRGLRAGRTYRVSGVLGGAGFAGQESCTERVEVPSGSTGVELRFDQGIGVTFLAVNKETRDPVERLFVNARLVGPRDFMDGMAFQMPNRASNARRYPGGRVTVAGLRGKPGQKLKLEVAALGYAMVERTGLAVPAQGVLDLGVLELSPLPMVHILVQANGQPVAGARVRLGEAGDRRSEMNFGAMDWMAGTGSKVHAGVTDEEGRCVLNTIPGQAVQISVSSKDHAPYQSGSLSLSAEGDARHLVQLVTGGIVEVLVVEAKGAPAVGVNIQHRSESGSRTVRKSDGEGRVRFERLAPGVHGFRIASGGGGMLAAFEEAQFRVGGDRAGEVEWTETTVVDGAVQEVELKRPEAGSLRGLVRQNGVPLEGAQVSFLAGEGTGERDDPAQQAMAGVMEALGGAGGGTRHSVRTDAQGQYTLKDLPAGNHRLRITHRDRAMPTVVSVSVQTIDGIFDVNLDMTSVSGTVRDPDGQPVARATVRAVRNTSGRDPTIAAVEGAMAMMPGLNLGGGNTVRTDEEGRYTVSGIEPGVEIAISASGRGFAPATSAPVVVERGSMATGVDVQLLAAGRIKVTVADAAPFTMVMATYEGEAGHVAPVMQMVQGTSTTLSGLRAGPWQVHLASSSGSKKTVEVKAGETVTIEL